ncbi:MAG: glycoside hydrolase family 127 protein [Clostridia bacterium]|nr:glycoside hydrolase family 127 protein [Clostridia bacterium]
MKKSALQFPQAGESKIFGYSGKIINYTLEAQLLNGETWKMLVDQFRLKWDGENRGWRGEYWGKMMRGASLTYRATKNEKLYTVLVDTVKDLLSTQEKDGRISSYTKETEFDGGWDVWSRKYILLGMFYFLDICKNKALRRKILTAMKRHADYIIKHVGNGKKQKSVYDTSWFAGGMNSYSILEPFVKLYVLTGEKRYLDFATYLVDSGLCYNFNLIEACLSKELYPYQFPQTKAYEMMSCFEGLLEYYKVTGNPEHLQAVENFVEMVVESDYTIIGCSGCYHELFDNSSKTQTEPAANDVMQETCVTVTFLKLCAKLLALTGEAKYAAYVEKSGLNALYGAVNNEKQKMTRTQARTWDGQGVMHMVKLLEPFPFDSYSPLYQDRRGFRVGGCQVLQDGKSYGCCVCIGAAGTAIMGLFAVMKGEDGVYVNLYNDCRFKTADFGEKISVDVFANPYRYKGAKLNVNGGGQTFALGLRIPAWAENFCVYVNGERAKGEEKNGYFVVNRPWNKDKVEVCFKAPVKMWVLNKKIAFTQGPITLARDCRFEDISKPVAISVKNGKNVRAKRIKNTTFNSNVAYEITTKEGKITLCDYAQAGKNYDEENSKITVWQDVVK